MFIRFCPNLNSTATYNAIERETMCCTNVAKRCTIRVMNLIGRVVIGQYPARKRKLVDHNSTNRVFRVLDKIKIPQLASLDKGNTCNYVSCQYKRPPEGQV